MEQPPEECRLNISRVQNRLSLSDKVQALKAYEELENYTQVGRLFKCSDKQIKTIVENKEKILAKYASNTSLDKSFKKVNFKESQEKRAEQIALLDKVVFEWFLRARRNPSVCLISHTLIQKIALDVKKALKIDTFAPNTAWLLRFRQMYNISDFDLKLQLKEPGPMELDIDVIISEVIKRENNESPCLASFEILDSDDEFPTTKENPNLTNSTSNKSRTSESPSSEENDEDPHSRNYTALKKKKFRKFVTNFSSRTQNRLSLHDKVQALKAYAKTGNFSQVGRSFNCSDKQIKSIVENKERIWALYSSYPNMTKVHNKGDSNYKERGLIRSKKVVLLHKVMYEWFLRAQRNPSLCSITKSSIINVALDAKKILDIEDFIPNDAWLVHFFQLYNITNLEKKLLPNNRGPFDLDIEAIVANIAERDKYNRPCSPPLDILNTDDDSSDAMPNNSTATRSRARARKCKSPLNVENNEDPPTNTPATRSRSLVSVASNCKSPSNVENDEDPPSKYLKLEPIDEIKIENESVYEGSIETTASCFEITNLDQALEHLKPLEDFALMREDYRVIGLVSQLEMVLRKSKQT